MVEDMFMVIAHKGRQGTRTLYIYGGKSAFWNRFQYGSYIPLDEQTYL